ncbi:FAD-dependent oxidoreductase [Rhizobium sp. SSA_523]|uniref:FAD-dependent oxidoreductase n=1 Tax=Rhizobium sp. SSA_523 TaxID=2952477 RepID=UPI002091B944|nr:FAD-dependent oxidoreductase [Rhizobium sp. SSA_523]MCO5733940.1 FAD-dependent monooxygenase [Rhizobium sp. SSA_523]WKC24798.1 FAD-dependent monooxygenase [Rhizobium sp. SSA_523]
MSIKSAAIIGAGMAGLTAALALSKRGIRVQIFEQAPYLAQVGAGLQISPNASRILDALGVLDRIEAVWTEPERISLASGRTLGHIAHVPVGTVARQRWKAPYGVLHRYSLQNALSQAVEDQPLCTLNLGRRIRTGTTEEIAAETGERPELIVGADGVWSSLREAIPSPPEPDFSHNVAWRFMLDASDAPRFLPPDSVTAFLGPSAHIICYPLREAGGFNVVAIASGVTPGETWDASATAAERSMLLRQFRQWNPQIVEMLRRAHDAKFWPLYQVSDGRWHDGESKVLIGDSAHAMMPFAAQGAAMAIEDAMELARQVSQCPTLAEALVSYEAIRKPRVERVRRRGQFNRFAYHLRGPMRLGRDVVLALRPPQALAADLDWLYGYDRGS